MVTLEKVLYIAWVKRYGRLKTEQFPGVVYASKRCVNFICCSTLNVSISNTNQNSSSELFINNRVNGFTLKSFNLLLSNCENYPKKYVLNFRLHVIVVRN